MSRLELPRGTQHAHLQQQRLQEDNLEENNEQKDLEEAVRRYEKAAGLLRDSAQRLYQFGKATRCQLLVEDV